MVELEFIRNERFKLEGKYFKEVKNIYLEFNGEEAAEKRKKLYSEYIIKDCFLESLQVRLEDILKDIENYKLNKRG